VKQIHEEIEQLIRDWHGPEGRLSIMLGPLGPQRCSTELLELCRDVAQQHGIGLHTHLLETPQQVTFANERFGRGMLEELASLGILGPGFSGAHAVWCSSADLDILASSGSAVVHNPWSNLTLGSGIADLPAWKRSGVGIALGTDGVNCGGNLNMFRAMSLAMVLHRSASIEVADWPSVDDVLSMATTGGAQVIGAADRIGSLEVGREADLSIVSTAATSFVPEDGLLGQLIHGESAEQVRTVLVAGRIVMEDRIITGVDLDALLGEALEMSRSIMSRNEALVRSAELQRDGLLDASRRAMRRV
jgi:cytosine/adenosine deaminase-related metal-dependent hydrolase